MDESMETGKQKEKSNLFLGWELSANTENVMSMDELEHIFLVWHQPIYRYTLSRVQNPNDAEDITSQVFISAFEKIGSYNEEGRFLGWLFRITKNKISDHYRRNRIQHLDLSEVEIIAHETMTRRDQFIDLINAINQLSQFDQDLLRLRYTAELTYQEVGHFLGKKEDAIRKAHLRIIKRLKTIMEK